MVFNFKLSANVSPERLDRVKEHRVEHRYKPSKKHPLLLRTDGGECLEVSDISKNGLSVLIENSINIGEIETATLIFGNIISFRVDLKNTWLIKNQACGFEILEIDEKGRHILNKYVSSLEDKEKIEIREKIKNDSDKFKVNKS
jgi:hypothetical protein